MPMTVRIAPSLLAADFARLADEIRLVEDAGADLLHLDVMDGHFVPNISFGLPVIEAVRRVTDLELDTHLMITEPLPLLGAFKDAGADSLTVHIEVFPDPRPAIEAIRSLRMKCGIAVNPASPVEHLFPWLSELDLVLIMSVEPGFGGQAFIPATLDKVRSLHDEVNRQGLDLPIQIDGGIKRDNASDCRRAGVSLLVAGSSIFGAVDRLAAITALRN